MINRKIPWTSQPQVPVGIDPSILRPNQSLVLLPGVNLPTTRVSRWGNEFHTADKYYYTASAPIADNNELTVVFAGRQTGATGTNYERYFEIGGGGTGGGFSVEQYSSERILGWITSGSISVVGDKNWVDNDLFGSHYYVATVANSVVSLFRDGMLIYTGEITTAAATTRKFAIGGATSSSGTGNRATNFGVSLFAIDFGRAVSQQVALKLSENPWQIFQPLQRKQFAVSAAGGTTLALTGQATTLAQGPITATVSKAITGQGLSLATGSISTLVQAPLNGQNIQLGQGTVGVVGDIPTLTGQSNTVSVGSVSVNVTKALTGQAVSMAAGNTAANVSPSLSGQGAILAQGDIIVFSGAVNRSITGQSVYLSQGSFSTGAVNFAKRQGYANTQAATRYHTQQATRSNIQTI